MSGPADQPAAGRPPPGRPPIIRRHPTGSFPRLDAPPGTGPEPQTSLISGAADPQTSLIGTAAEQTSLIPRPQPSTAGSGTAVAAAVLSILSGWATAVIATDLITGWWQTDRLFCVAVGFLTTVSAAAMIGGLILVLLRRRMGRLLIVVGSVIGLLIFSSLFLAGATLAPVVYAIPVLPVASILLTLHPATGRWARSG